MAEKKTREMLSSRLGFLLLSAGCAIGLGNVWRFPYITGNYGGAIFFGIFLICLLAVVPIMIMEFAVGRAARRNMGLAFRVLEQSSAMRGREGNRRVFGVTVASGVRDVVRTVDLTREEDAVARERARSMFESLNGLDPKVALGVLAELGILISTRSEGEQNG